MAFPSIAGTAVGSVDTSVATFSVGHPAGMTAGELLLVFIAQNAFGTISWGAGGAELTRIDTGVNGTTIKGEIWARLLTGGEASSSTMSTSGAGAGADVAAVSMRIQNHGVSNLATDIIIGTAATGNSSTPDPGNCNPGVARDWLWLASFASEDDDNTTPWGPANYTEILQQESAQTTSSCMMGVAYRQLNASAEDAGAFAMSAANLWRAITIAIPPAAARLAAGQGSFSLTGQTVALLQGRRLVAVQGAFALSGQAATLRGAHKLLAAQGSYLVSGQIVALQGAHRVVLVQGAYAIAGQDAGLRAGRRLAPDQGAYVLTGEDAALTFGGGAAAYSMAADPGSFALAGQDVGLLAGHLLAAAQGAFAVAGQDIGLLAARLLALETGLFALDGQDVALVRGLLLALEQGAFITTGFDVAFLLGIVALLPNVEGAIARVGALVAALERDASIEGTLARNASFVASLEED